MKYRFTYDFVTLHEDIWRTFLGSYANLPGVNLLEIGTFEGRSTIWFLENILQNADSRITCIDSDFPTNFYFNIAQFSSKVVLYSGNSHILLRNPLFLIPSFDIIYIDGEHMAADVLEDAILSFTALKTGGVMIFDDYLWDEAHDEKSEKLDPQERLRRKPKIAVDAFVNIYRDKLEIIHKAYQVIIRKIL